MRCGTQGIRDAHTPGVRAVGSEAPGTGVRELALEDGVQSLACGGVVHGRDGLDASPQVAGPPVGRADVVLRGSSVRSEERRVGKEWSVCGCACEVMMPL